MSTRDQLHRVMSEIGPMLELAAVVESDEGDGWLLAIDEEDAVLVELDDAQDRIFLSADAGVPPEEARLRLYEMLLVYNRQWPASGGVRMALEEPGGEVVQMLELPAAGLDATRLGQILVSYLEILAGWRAVVSGRPRPEEEADTAVPGGGIPV